MIYDEYFLLLVGSFPFPPLLPGPPAGPPGYVFSITSLQHDVILVWLHELWEDKGKKRRESTVCKNMNSGMQTDYDEVHEERGGESFRIFNQSGQEIRGSLLQELGSIPNGLLFLELLPQCWNDVSFFKRKLFPSSSNELTLKTVSLHQPDVDHTSTFAISLLSFAEENRVYSSINFIILLHILPKPGRFWLWCQTLTL